MRLRTAAIVAALLILAIGWYLGSPLLIRTTANEPMPTAAASASALPVSSAGGTIAPTTAPSATAIVSVLRRGELQYVDALHHGQGTVLVLAVDAKEFVRFEDVAITNAPDVHVYLTKDRGGRWSDATSTYLGPLKATNGSFNYELPPSIDLAAYGSVVVWCRLFSVLVTWADLGPA